MTKTVVIPAYKASKTIKDVILSVPEEINHIIVVDDKCPDFSGKEAESLNIKNVEVLFNEKNQGVGGAVITGYKKALELKSDIIIKIDGDGQMDASCISNFSSPILNGEADYTKGNRFSDFASLKSMPKARLIGNSALSFLVKAASGYWNVMDPTNGFTAIHSNILKKLDLDRISKDYFFESDMLIQLNIAGGVVKDINISSKYGGENSSLNVRKALCRFPFKLFKGFLRRIFVRYFVYDFNMASVYILLGLPMFLFGVVFGAFEWIESIRTGVPRSAGTIMLVALPVIIGFQMLLGAVRIDIDSIPKK